MPINTVPKLHTETVDAIVNEFTALPQVVHVLHRLAPAAAGSFPDLMARPDA